MEYIATFLVGIFLGAIIMAIVTASGNNQELENAETRAKDYARLIKKIEDISLKPGYGSIVDRLDKIKEVIQSPNTNNF